MFLFVFVQYERACIHLYAKGMSQIVTLRACLIVVCFVGFDPLICFFEFVVDVSCFY